jgi:hypothetical protein
MALARVTVWNPGDVLTASALNGEINNILDNPTTLISPSTGAINFNLLSHTGILPTVISATSGSAGQVFAISPAGTPAWEEADDVINVVDYGAVGDGVADDLASIQAAHDALPATGGTLWFPVGEYRVEGTLNITKSVHLRGAGGSGSSGTGSRITQATASATMFSVATVSPVQFSNLLLSNSAGAACVHVVGTTPTNENVGSIFDGVAIGDGAVGLDFERALRWTVRNCYIVNTTTACIRVRNTQAVTQDGGDSNIQGSVFDLSGGGTGDCIIWHGSGGLRVENNKILGNLGTTVGFHLVPDTGVDTSDILVVGNSFENSAYGILFEGSGGSVENIVISANQFAIIDTSHITLAPSVAANASIITITGNTFTSGIDIRHIDCAACELVMITGNVFIGAGGAGSDAVFVGASAVNVHVGSNEYSGIVRALVSASASTHTTGITPSTFANLPASIGNGSVMFCTDGTIANPVAGGGTGCIAKRLNGAWVGN